MPITILECGGHAAALQVRAAMPREGRAAWPRVRERRHGRRTPMFFAVLLLLACSKPAPPPQPQKLPVLLITLDTTRADAITPEIAPNLTQLKSRGMFFTQAYTAVPQTLPAHVTMLTGIYPAAHGVHENARPLAGSHPLVSEKLHANGYRTAAFVSAFALARRFGTARGFETYDDDFGSGAERTATETTNRALAWLAQQKNEPFFLWVHYYDPHYPYTPPEPYRTRFAKQPYFGEVAYMDAEVGRLLAALKQPAVIVIAGDHGEGLGDHGESQHGNLLYQSTVHVPLWWIAPGVKAGASDVPISTRHVFDLLLQSALPQETVIAGEAMKPFLDYGWQPQVMAIEGRQKTILAGATEVYDVLADPGETHNLAPQANVSREVRQALREYPVPSLAEAATSALSNEERKQLAALGYVASSVKPVVRKDAPRPADMAPLFPILDEAAGLFVREQYAKAIPLLEQILQKDPYNLDAALRLATAHSSLGNEQQALAAFERAQAIAPDSPDVRTYLALHLARGKEWQRAVPMLEQILAAAPDKVPAIEALALIRERQGRFEEALTLLQRLYALRTPSPTELVHLGQLAMQLGNTPVAIDAFEKAHSDHDLELGVLYLDADRLTEARDALDRVPPAHPDYAMALFKRAQVSVLLHEPDAPARIAAAREHANGVTRGLIERERLFR
ncbi:MAG TPA: sulfatase-like hydrolase/transferase [Thermoanaerobaculia bacterium]|nr:sulfatase-like hydrolase/transferase [Thermoanaerobaculia bacterium]